MKSKKTAMYGLLVALAFILSYIESLIPFPFIPGIKLGLANLVVIVALYGMGWKEAFVLSLIRIILVGFTFGNLSTMLYSLAGGLLSWLMMVLAKKSKWFSMVGVSIIGGISHNIGQIIVAILTVSNVYLVTYLPVLLITGAITGALIGFLGALIVKRIKRLF
ncbi:MAG TPA: heptaprenyl diphosphate synthase [Lachnospiraceae bacterium]|jgi:heptaprenyl diphosphate synthase|nr:heptaprenyl diphosphate synthase [Lachnospiraceae bacterium]HCA70822.1 heptaprenyl diphosphate synthase [Lachnospiraceae bacterium]HCR40754.1 heptaprenyl diphosphate synthase [Lachnospiraceae bacterium]